LPRVNLRALLRSLAQRLALLAVGAVVAALLFEGLVLLVFGEQPKFPRRVVGSPAGIRINEPNARYRHKSADVNIEFRINSQGMRADRDYARDKPAGVRRVVVLGDSYTMGYEVDEPECYARVLERELASRGDKVEVLNGGVSGYSTAEAYLRLTREMLAYQPDAVVIGFYGNDIVDNVRTGLYRLDGERLVQAKDRYVPGGGWGDFLNTNWFFSFLAERSNAFVLLKERFTQLARRRMVEENVRNVDAADKSAEKSGADTSATSAVDPKGAYGRRLTAALFEEIYKTTREHGLSLVILSIPWYRQHPDRLAEAFPVAEFPVERPGLSFVPAKTLLDPYVGKEQLYWHQSHGHWTPLAHEVAGKALADTLHGAWSGGKVQAVID
jgi:hypothetical protein